MDTSETFVRMCEKATEIQEQRPKFGLNNVGLLWIELGSWFFDKESGDLVCFGTIGADYKYWKEIRTLGELIWLPRQDQLQEIYLKFRNFDINGKEYAEQIDFHHCLDNIHFFYFDGNEAQRSQTMEQLWLAFVMFELYHKTWDGDNWI